jgi:hypothetical protein
MRGYSRMHDKSQDTCTAPVCTRPAEWIVTGEDFDGTPFVERTCSTCGLYLLSAGAECGKVVDYELIHGQESGREDTTDAAA